MATRDQFIQVCRAQPFEPFKVHLAGGPALTVNHPELAACSVNGRELVVFDNQGAHYLDMRLVTMIEPILSRANLRPPL